MKLIETTMPKEAKKDKQMTMMTKMVWEEECLAKDREYNAINLERFYKYVD
jgi:hypothetical protein